MSPPSRTRSHARSSAAIASVSATAFALACSGADDERDNAASGAGIGSLTGGTAATGGDDSPGMAASAADSSGAGSEGAAPLFDLGGAEGGAEVGPDEGCSRVDFLFVIDNSVSMEGEQAALVGAFPGFIDTIQSTLQADGDYHILVTDTDAWGRCDTVNGFVGISPGSDTCNAYIQSTAFEACDAVRGAGVVHPAGQFATNAACNLAGAQRYIQPGEPDLAARFACTATVGVAGHSSERPMESMIAALSPELNAAGACNDGFLRDDALLVITFVSDDPKYEDTGMPEQWYQAVLAAKGGLAESVVVLGLTPAWDACPGTGTKGAHWQEFVELWGDRGIHGSVCGTAADYVAFFELAVATIDQACDEFVPPG